MKIIMNNRNNKSLWKKIRKLIKDKIKQHKEQVEIEKHLPLDLKLKIGLTRPSGIMIIIFAFIFYQYISDYTTEFSNLRFNSYVAKYHMLDECLDISNKYSKIIRRNSVISYFFRNILMNNYIIAKETFEKDFYNSSGLFFSICRDYKLAQSIHTKNKENLTEHEIEQFLNYKQQFLTELYSLLMEYRDRKHSISNFIRLGYWRENVKYRIPNRITFYPELAVLYLATKEHFKINDETLNDFKYIYDTLNIVYNQEKEANTRSYRTFVNNYSRLDQKQFKTFYPIFIREYARLIILLNNDLHPETDICKESDICEEYMSAAEKYNFETDTKVLSIIHKK